MTAPPSREASRQPTPSGSERGAPRVPAEGVDSVLEQTIGYRYAARWHPPMWCIVRMVNSRIRGHVKGGLQTAADGRMLYAVRSWLVLSHKENPNAQTYLRGHKSPISCLQISPSGKLAASGESGKDSDVIVWDLATQKIIYRLSEHDFGVAHVAFSHDEKLLLTISTHHDNGGKVIAWDLSSGLIVASTKRPGFYVSTGAERPHHTMQRINDTQLLLSDDSIQAVCFSPKLTDAGHYSFVTAGKNFETQARGPEFWNLDPYQGIFTHVKGETRFVQRVITCARWTPDGQLLLCGTTSGDVLTFLNKRLQQLIPTTNAAVTHVVGPLPNGVYVAAGGNGSLVPFAPDVSLPYARGDYRTPGVPDELRLTPAAELMGGVSSISYIPGTVEVVCGTTHALMYLVNLDTLEVQFLRENHMGAVTQVALCAAEPQLMATSSVDKSVMLWSLADYSVLFKSTHRGAGACRSVFLADDLVYSGWDDGKVRAHVVPTGELVWTLEAHSTPAIAVARSHGGHFLVTACEAGECRVWDLHTRGLVSVFTGHGGPVTALEVFDGDEAVLSSSRDRTLAVWDVRSGSRLAGFQTRMGGVTGAVLGTDQVQVVSVGQDRRLTFWDLREPHAVQSVADVHAEEPTCLCMSPDGTLLASGGKDMVVRVWEFATGKLLSEVMAHSDTISSVKFGFDNCTLVTASSDGSVALWKVVGKGTLAPASQKLA